MFRFILAPNDLKDIRNGLAYFALLWNVEVYQFSHTAFAYVQIYFYNKM